MPMPAWQWRGREAMASHLLVLAPAAVFLIAAGWACEVPQRLKSSFSLPLWPR